MILDDLHILLPNIPVSKDNLLTLYIRKAVTLITNYLNLSTVAITETNPCTGVITTTPPIDVAVAYPDAICDYAVICFNKRGNEGIKQGSAGSMSQTYGNDLPDSTIALLPLPCAVMLDTRRNYYHE